MATPCGGKEIRTPDIQLAKLALYQLSYAPMESGDFRGWREGKRRWCFSGDRKQKAKVVRCARLVTWLTRFGGAT